MDGPCLFTQDISESYLETYSLSSLILSSLSISLTTSPFHYHSSTLEAINNPNCALLFRRSFNNLVSLANLWEYPKRIMFLI